MIRFSSAVCPLLLVCAMNVAAHAQRGSGDLRGVAQQPTKPELVTLEGALKSIEIGPCQLSTGRSGVGTHLILKTKDEETVNLHLGPTAVVDRYIEGLTAGMSVKSQAFRTPALPEDHYVAQQIRFGDKVVTLRSESLRPIWAGRGMDGQPAHGHFRPAGRGGRQSASGPWWANEDWSESPSGRGFGRQFRGTGSGYGRGRGPTDAR